MSKEIMDLHFEPLSLESREPVIDIFNYYIENSFAAYPDRTVPYDFFAVFLKMTVGYPAVTVQDAKGNVLGFGQLHAYHPIATFSRTAEITYFLSPGYTGRGIGHTLLEYLLGKALEMGLSSVLASISSLNDGSIKFHKKTVLSNAAALWVSAKRRSGPLMSFGCRKYFADEIPPPNMPDCRSVSFPERIISADKRLFT